MAVSPYTPDTLYDAERAFAAAHGMSGAALDEIRSLRLKLDALPDDHHRIAAWIAAPVLAGFSVWLAEQAAQHDQPALLGVMREGQILCRLMEELHGIPAKEIWLNRSLSMLGAFGCGDDEALINWLARTRVQLLTAAGAAQHLFGTASPGDDTQQPIDIDGAYKLQARWKNDGRLENARKRASEIADKILMHLQSVAPSEKRPILLMDFASVGNIQRSLLTIGAARGQTLNIVGLNFAMTAGSRWAEEKGCRMQGWLSERGEPVWFGEAYGRLPELIEIFTAALVGSLENYDKNGAPVYGKSFLSPERHKRIESLQSCVIESAAVYHRTLGKKLTADLGRCLWGRVLTSPLPGETEALSGWPLDAGLDGSNRRALMSRSTAGTEVWIKESRRS